MCRRQQKAQQLIALQSELHLLDSDIKQVAARQPDAHAAPQDQHQPLHPARQPSTQLLQERLQEAMSSVDDASSAQQSASSSKPAHTAVGSGSAGQAQASLQAAPTAVQLRASNHFMATSLPVTTRMPSALHHQQPAVSPAATAVVQQATLQPGIMLAPPGGSQLPPFPSASQQPVLHQQPAAAAIAAAVDPSRPLNPRLSRTSNGYLMIAHPPSPAPTAPPQHTQPTAVVASSSASGTAPAALAVSNAVPLPTQLDRQHSMHIHPRHLAFQHFHQQQAALQQRQQPAGQNRGVAGASHAASTGSIPPDDSPAQVTTQDAAVRYVCWFCMMHVLSMLLADDDLHQDDDDMCV